MLGNQFNTLGSELLIKRIIACPQRDHPEPYFVAWIVHSLHHLNLMILMRIAVQNTPSIKPDLLLSTML